MLDKIHEFMRDQVKTNRCVRYRVLHYSQWVGITEVPNYQVMIDYQTEADRTQAFEQMKSQVQEEPHASLMHLVGNFRVAFSQDIVANPTAKRE